MDAGDRLGLGEREQVVVAAQVARPVGEPAAAEVGLAEPVLLDHRAHRAVEHEDARLQEGGQRLRAVRAQGGLGQRVSSGVRVTGPVQDTGGARGFPADGDRARHSVRPGPGRGRGRAAPAAPPGRRELRPRRRGPARWPGRGRCGGPESGISSSHLDERVPHDLRRVRGQQLGELVQPVGLGDHREHPLATGGVLAQGDVDERLDVVAAGGRLEGRQQLLAAEVADRGRQPRLDRLRDDRGEGQHGVPQIVLGGRVDHLAQHVVLDDDREFGEAAQAVRAHRRDDRQHVVPVAHLVDGADQRVEQLVVLRGGDVGELGAVGEVEVADQVERLGPHVVRVRGVDQADHPVPRDGEQVVEPVLVLEDERGVQQRLVALDGRDGGAQRGLGQQADEAAHRHVLLARDELPPDRDHDRGGDGGDHGGGAPGIHHRGDVGQERDGHLARDLRRPRRVEQAGGGRAQHRPEGELGELHRERQRQQLARGGNPLEPLGVTAEEPVGDLLAERREGRRSAPRPGSSARRSARPAAGPAW